MRASVHAWLYELWRSLASLPERPQSVRDKEDWRCSGRPQFKKCRPCLLCSSFRAHATCPVVHTCASDIKMQFGSSECWERSYLAYHAIIYLSLTPSKSNTCRKKDPATRFPKCMHDTGHPPSKNPPIIRRYQLIDRGKVEGIAGCGGSAWGVLTVIFMLLFFFSFFSIDKCSRDTVLALWKSAIPHIGLMPSALP